jgi:hypothetical protein
VLLHIDHNRTTRSPSATNRYAERLSEAQKAVGRQALRFAPAEIAALAELLASLAADEQPPAWAAAAQALVTDATTAAATANGDECKVTDLSGRSSALLPTIKRRPNKQVT